MKRGRKRLPDAVKRRRGNPGGHPGSRKLAPPEIVPKSELPKLLTPPVWLPKKALPIWNEYVAQAVAGSVMTFRDKHELANLVVAEYQLRKAVARLERDGIMVKGSVGQKVKNPMIQVVHAMSMLCTRLRGNFGMNPSARSGMRLPDGGTAPAADGKSAAEKEAAQEAKAVRPFQPRVFQGGKK